MDSKKIFELENVSFSYNGEEDALCDISLSISRGEKIVLLGANGCGKSTLLKILNGLLFPQKGNVYFLGEILNDANLGRGKFNLAFRRRVGFVFQNSEAQLFNSRVSEEIAYGPVQMGLDAREVRQRVEEAAAMLGLEHLMDRPPFKLSGGEKKKVALASVLSINPDVILLDEPTSNLDPRTQNWLVTLLQQLNQAGKTLVTSTNNLDIVERIADYVLVFGEDHRLAGTGKPCEILNNRELLLRVNLVGEHFHSHTHGGAHHHYHAHD